MALSRRESRRLWRRTLIQKLNASDQFNQSIFVENFENDKNNHRSTSKEEIATRATAIIINGDLGSLSEKICGVYRAAKDRQNLFIKDGDISICVIKSLHRWELKTEDQLKSKSYIGFFHNLSDDFSGDSVQLLTDRSGRCKSLARGDSLTVSPVPKQLIMIGKVNGYWPELITFMNKCEGLFKTRFRLDGSLCFEHVQTKSMLMFNSADTSWRFVDLTGVLLATIKCDQKCFLPTENIGTELRVSRGSCSVIIAHQLRFEALDSSISKNASQSEIFDMRSEISELRDENYTLKKQIKELKLQLDQKSAHIWHCQICMEEGMTRLVLGCGHSVCVECQDLLHQCPFCAQPIDTKLIRRLYDN